MADEDPWGETTQKVSGHMVLALTIAARVVEVHMHRRAQQARQQALHSQEAARAAEQQIRAEATVAKQELRGVGSKEWWDKATPEEVAAKYAVAQGYGRLDPELATVAERMAGEIRERYGVDPHTLVAQQEAAAAAATAQAEAEQRAAQETAQATAVAAREAAEVEQEIVRHVDVLDKLPESLRAEFGVLNAPAVEASNAEVHELLDRIESGAAKIPSIDALMAPAGERDEQRQRARAESGEAAALVTEADRVDVAVRADGKVDAHEAAHDVPFAKSGWDSAGRREALAARLEGAGVPVDAAQARLVTDGLHAQPAAQATSGKPSVKAPKARQGADRGVERARGR